MFRDTYGVNMSLTDIDHYSGSSWFPFEGGDIDFLGHYLAE